MGATPLESPTRLDEKKDDTNVDVKVLSPDDVELLDSTMKEGIVATKEDLMAMEEKLSTMSLERCKAIMKQVYKMHQYDQNFPIQTLEHIKDLLENPDITENPERHIDLINAMKLEALLVTENSPYAEVRAVVDPTDDPEMPSLTFRVWFIGVIFAGLGAFINQLFSLRQPPVTVTSQVAQLIAWPAGKFLEQSLPRKSFRLFGREHSLNPGPFNRKEHMLITIMATVAFNTPYTGYIVFVQALPQFFNQPYAKKFGYQILNSLGSNFVGYGLAGLCRRFIVYPSFCVWPSSLTALAINKAFHQDDKTPVKGPFNRVYAWSRMKFFLVAFVAMFCYWWFPAFIFKALSTFNWMSWIAPHHVAYNAIVGFNNGLGLNPWPTFDFNVPMFNGWTPLVVPLFAVINQWFGMLIGFVMIVGFWWTNWKNTGYLPINSNHTFNNKGKSYNVSMIIDDRGFFDNEKYQSYSEPWMAAGNLNVYFWFFAVYSATVSYTFLYHRHEVVNGFKGFWRSIKRTFKKGDVQFGEGQDDLAEDIHFRLMRNYKEVPEWCYFIVLLCALGVGMAGVAAYPTFTTPAVVIYGIIMALIFVVPVGLIYAVTGVQVTMNVLAEFIGGSFSAGDALSMNYFKMYGYITTAQAIYFSSDLKLAHYAKIPPWHTFAAQIVATLVSTFVCVAVFNFQMGFRDVCTEDAAFNMSCPGEGTFFTASVFWGTVSPKRLFGPGGRYTALLAGFPVGFVMPFMTFYLRKLFPKVNWIRALHPVMICSGNLLWAPYNLSYFWPMVMMTIISWQWIKPRYLAFWSRYNYVLAASWTAAIAIAAIVIFFGLQIPDVSIDWWGNNADTGCEAKACPRLHVPDGGYFGGAPGTFN